MQKFSLFVILTFISLLISGCVGITKTSDQAPTFHLAETPRVIQTVPITITSTNNNGDAFHQNSQVSLSSTPDYQITIPWENGFTTTKTTIKYNKEEIGKNPPLRRTQRSDSDTYSWLTDGEYDKIFCKNAADQIIESSRGGQKPYESLTAFVRTGIVTRNDIDMFGVDDYAQSPAETLTSGEGDSEDKAALLALLLKQEGYDVAMIRTPPYMGVNAAIIQTREHIVTGINVDNIPEFKIDHGSPDTKDKIGGKYLIIETTNYVPDFQIDKPYKYLEEGQTVARNLYYTPI